MTPQRSLQTSLAIVRGLWQREILQVVAGGGAVSVAILVLLARMLGGPDFHRLDSESFTVIAIMLPMLLISIIVVGTMHRLSATYLLPVTTGRIVLSALVGATLLTAFVFATVIEVVSIVVGQSLPLAQPLLMTVMLTLGGVSIRWAFQRSNVLQAVGLAVVIGALTALINFDSNASFPVELWTLGWRESAIAFSTMIGSAAVMLAGVRRDRHGRGFHVRPLIEWLTALCFPERDLRLLSPVAAQRWYHWFYRGRITVGLGAVPVLMLVLALPLLLAGGLGRAAVAIEAFFPSFVMLSVIQATIIGMIVGQTSPFDKPMADMGSFMATRPLTDAEYARCSLSVMLRTLASLWGVWAAGLVLLFGVVLTIEILDSGPASTVFADIQLLVATFPGYSEIGPAAIVLWGAGIAILHWSLMSAGAATTMTGRSNFLAALALVVCGLFLVVLVCMASGIKVLALLAVALIGVASLTLIVGMLTANVVAFRRGYVSSRTAFTAIAAWCLGAAAIVMLTVSNPANPNASPVDIAAWLMFIVGVCAIPCGTLSAAPLATHWNRHR